MTVIAFDSETHLIGPGNIAPPMVCGIFTARDVDGALDTCLLGNHPDDKLEDMIEWMLTSEDVDTVVTHNGGFDYAVICRTYPRLIPLVFDALIEGRCTDTLWREKLLNLSTSGRLEAMEMPDGSSVNVRYRLQDLVASYLGLDIGDDKDDETSWRLNFNTLDGWRADEYPPEAAAYATADGELTLRVYEAQELRKDEWGMSSTETEEFQLLKSFVLYLHSAWGMEVDPEATDALEAAVTKVMDENRDLLEQAGILRPDNIVGPPYAKDEARAYDLLIDGGAEIDPCGLPEEIEDWTPYAEALRAHGIRFKAPAGKPGSKNTKVLQQYLADLYHRLGEIPAMTDGGAREPQIKCDAEVQEYLAGKDPVMAQYYERAALGKLATQMIPVLRSGPVVYPSYDAIKETGRTSSYDGGKRKENGQEIRLYPSVNIQQIPNEIKGLDPRRCFRPRSGRVFFDVDFTGLELACVAHVTYELFGESMHRDLYNSGVDLHGYLGTQLALKSSPNESKDKPWLVTLTRDFQNAIREEGLLSRPRAAYESFLLLKQHEESEVQAFFKHFRDFAKPVGLGFPGGLGPATMVEFARKTYKVDMTEEEAYAYREFWRETYPEMPRFFEWINGQTDEFNSAGENTLYTYTTPMGMIRRGASFCAAANGMCMQSPGAEAAMTADALVTRACYDHTQGSVLFGCRPIAFVHDQIIGETTNDPTLWAAQCEEVARLMRQGAEIVLHSIKMRTDEALLTEVWSKAAKPVRDQDNNLIPWRPE